MIMIRIIQFYWAVMIAEFLLSGLDNAASET